MVNKKTTPSNSIERRVIGILFIAVIFIAVLFFTSSQLLTQRINAQNDRSFADKQSNQILGIFQLKHQATQTLAEDYSYWNTLYNYVEQQKVGNAEYEKILGHLVNVDFHAVVIHSLDFKLLFSKTSASNSTSQIPVRQVNLDKLKGFGDVVHSINIINNELFVTSSRAIFSSTFGQKPIGYISFIIHVNEEFYQTIRDIVDINFTVKLPTNTIFNLIDGIWDLSYKFDSMYQSNDKVYYTYRLYNRGKPGNIKLTIEHKTSNFKMSNYIPFVAAQLLTLCLVIILVFVIIRAYITKPIIDLEQWVTKKSSNEKEPFIYQYDDELANLARSIQSSHNNLSNLSSYHSALLNTISDIIITTDTEMRVVYCNPAALSWLNGSSNDIIGQPLDFILNSTSGDSVAYWFSTVFNKQREYKGYCRLTSIYSTEMKDKEANIQMDSINNGKNAAIIIKYLE